MTLCRHRRVLGSLCLLAQAALASCRSGSLLLAQLGDGSAPAGLGGTGSRSPGDLTGPDVPGSPKPPPNPTSPAATQFHQGLFRGQDPRLVQRGGFYYYSGYVGNVLTLYKSASMVDLGTGKNIGQTLGGALGSPIFIDSVGGQTVNAWYIFGAKDLYYNSADPYDSAGSWARIAAMPWTDVPDGSSVPFDYEVFKNPQDGPYRGRWYLVWARNDPAPPFENIFIAEIAALSASSISLSPAASTAANRIIVNRADWTDVIVEAPGVAIHGQSVTLAYSGNGAPTTLYALGLSTLKMGADPTLSASWMDLNRGQCDGYPGGGATFAKTGEVAGPGVARFVKSADQSEDWMIFHAKIFDTFDATSGTPEPQQTHNEMWSRYLNLQKIGWTAITCAGQAYSLPQLGQPLPQGQAINLPAGDPGPTAKAGPLRIEAESMIAFGAVMGSSIQSLQSPQKNTMVLAVECPGCSAGYKVGNLAELARDQPTAPQQSGLIFRNSPPGSAVNIAHGNAQAASLDLYIQGKLAQTLSFGATGGDDTYKVDSFPQLVHAGDEIKLIYEVDRSGQVNLDYLEIVP